MINETAYVIENGMVVTKVTMKRYRDGFFLVTFPDGSFSALRSGRLFLTEKAAKESMERKIKKITLARRTEGYDSPYRYMDPHNRYGA